jgi:tetraacyldisaccharide 4'-kinase
MLKLKRAYLTLIEKDKKTYFEQFVFLFLLIFSFIFKLIATLRNFLYNKNLLKIYRIDKKIISIGGISWGGSGKTSMVIYLHKYLSSQFRVASITKGYATDEYSLIKAQVKDVFDAKNRVDLIKQLASDFDVFILDDGFQYRKLARDLDIVLIRRENLQDDLLLIPAGSFREPLRSLGRADIVIVTYCKEDQLHQIKSKIVGINNNLRIFSANYEFKKILDRDKNEVSLDYFKGKRVGLLTAIGNPRGFLEKLSQVGIRFQKALVYPDHYQFWGPQLRDIEDDFLREDIKDIVITYKDFYHLNLKETRLNYFIFEVELKIDREEEFLEEVRNVLFS